MGLHLGEGRLRVGGGPGEPEDYVGIDVNYAARIAAAGNGGQIVLSQALVEALGPDGAVASARLAVRRSPTRASARSRTSRSRCRLHRLVVAGAADDPRPLRTLEPPSNLPGRRHRARRA